MKPIEAALEPITGYLVCIKRNPKSGWYELEVGLPASWVYDTEHSDVEVSIVSENETGKLIKIFPRKIEVCIDDLIAFAIAIIETNERIAEKEKQFTNKMQEMRNVLENEAKKFYQELDELKQNSFKAIKAEKTRRKYTKQSSGNESGETTNEVPVTESTKNTEAQE